MHGIAIMKSDRIADAWKCSCRKSISTIDPMFVKHRVPPFFKLGFTSTGLTVQREKEIEALIKANGGEYYEDFDSAESVKLKAARDCSKHCLAPAWVVDSVRKGYALPVLKYQIKSQAMSIPSTSDKNDPIPYFTNAENVYNINKILCHQMN